MSDTPENPFETDLCEPAAPGRAAAQWAPLRRRASGRSDRIAATTWCRDIEKRASQLITLIHICGLFCVVLLSRESTRYPVGIRSTHSTDCMQECRAKRFGSTLSPCNLVGLRLFLHLSIASQTNLQRSGVQSTRKEAPGVTVVSCSADI